MSSSYRNILKSTSLIGGASILNIFIGMIRTKFVAVLLGTNGVGLMGMYMQITGLMTTLSGMGLSSSGVRQVAEAVGTCDNDRIARTVLTLRRTAWLTGVLGLLGMSLLCVPISWVSFNSSDYALPIALLSITILFAAISSAQACVLQGTRRIADIARISVIGALTGTLISIPFFFFWGQEGIMPSLIICSFSSLVTSWWFSRRVQIKLVEMSWFESLGEARQMIIFGISLMGANLIIMVTNYFIRILLARQFGFDGVGIYLAAFSLSAILADFVFSAMGADYYPRLTGVVNDNELVRRIVNEQTEVSILLALPGLMSMMVFSPLIIQIFYTGSFAAAVPILRWCMFGVLGRVFSWPLVYLILALGNGRLFFFTHSVCSGFHLIVLYVFCRLWGLEGSGIAFMMLYFFYTVFTLYAMHRQVGMPWTYKTLVLTLITITVMSVLMLNCSLNHDPISAWVLNVVLLSVVTGFCLWQLSRRTGIGLKGLSARFRKITCQ